MPTHKHVLQAFKDIFGVKDEGITLWFPNGKNSVRIRLTRNRPVIDDVVFTLFPKTGDWKLETEGSYRKGLEK